MILRGTTLYRDGHGKYGLLSSPFHYCLTPFTASPFARPHTTPHLDRGLACVSCESVPYVMDVLGNRGRHHLDGRRVAVRHYNAVRATKGIFARKETTGHRWKTRAACPTASRVTANEPR